MSEEDLRVVTGQLGRKPRGEIFVASRCLYGLVEVIINPPLLEGYIPFPTLYWLTCPVLRSETGKLEAGSFRDYLKRKLRDDPEFFRELRRAEEDYVREREELARILGMKEKAVFLPDHQGIAGSNPGSMKCLHSHLAHYLARGVNPIGREMQRHLKDVQRKRCKGDCRS